MWFMSYHFSLVQTEVASSFIAFWLWALPSLATLLDSQFQNLLDSGLPTAAHHLEQILMGVNELLKSPPLNGPFPYYSNVVASISNASILGLVKNILQNI